jgi:hypothetical protein
MTERNIEQVLRDHGDSYNAPPPEGPPLEEMWNVIRTNMPGRVSRRWWQPGRRVRLAAALAATMLVGFVLGRASQRIAAPTEAARVAAARSTSAEESAMYSQTTSAYLLRTAALLLALPGRSEPAARLDTVLLARASDLLSTTRLLIDSPAAVDPDIRNLMSDLELVLAQIVQLRSQTDQGELDLITDVLQERELLPRIHTAVTTSANN